MPAGLNDSENLKPNRKNWVDSAKGLGILLVVLGHAIGGVANAGLISKSDPLQIIFNYIYTTHMPFFFFLSGLFLQQRLKESPADFIKSLSTRIVIPYFVWTLVQISVIASLGSLVNVPVRFEDINPFIYIIKSTSQFWFLHALFIMHIAGYIISRYSNNLIVGVALALLCIPALLYTPLDPNINNVLRFFIFYALGVAYGPHLISKSEKSEPAAFFALGCGCLWIVFSKLLFDSGQRYWSIAAVPAALCGLAALLYLARVPAVANNKMLIEAGKASMAIFLLHILFVAGTRIIGVKIFGGSDLYGIVILSTLVGVLAPIFVHRICKMSKFAKTVGLG